jgi:hypothetical protein
MMLSACGGSESQGGAAAGAGSDTLNDPASNVPAESAARRDSANAALEQANQAGAEPRLEGKAGVEGAEMLQFDKREHDFGSIKTGKPVETEFKFKNTYTKPVKLSGVKASCGCTTPDYTKSLVPVGGSGFVKATYNNKSEGRINKTLTVTAVSEDGKDTSRVILKLRGEGTK